MYNVNDLVYIYFGDLKLSLPKNKLNINRFGKIIRRDEVSQNMFNYTIKCKNNKTMLVKSYDKSFNICNIEELLNIIHISKIDEQDKILNIELVNTILDYYK